MNLTVFANTFEWLAEIFCVTWVFLWQKRVQETGTMNFVEDVEGTNILYIVNTCHISYKFDKKIISKTSETWYIKLVWRRFSCHEELIVPTKKFFLYISLPEWQTQLSIERFCWVRRYLTDSITLLFHHAFCLLRCLAMASRAHTKYWKG